MDLRPVSIPHPSAKQPRWPGLGPFQVRSFRFQWPADLLTSWAFEMETLILGWYVLVETGSVFLLTVLGSLQFLGTLLAPFFGVAGDRLGRRTMMCGMRIFYALLACVIMALGLSGLLQPLHVFPVAFLAGLVRPSDVVMRNALIGDTMTSDRLLNARGLSRRTFDTARIAGALIGAGLFASLGIGPAYVFVAGFYALSFCLSLGVSRTIAPATATGGSDSAGPMTLWASRWRDLREGMAYIWATPAVLGLLWFAFIVNLTAIPLTHGLLPYVAREIYGTDETGLSHLVAGFAGGALIGSTIMVVTGGHSRSARFMILYIGCWFAALAIFAQLETKWSGFGGLVAVGAFYSLAMISMSGALLRAVSGSFRGRVMGVRMLAVYGLPVGLMASSPLIAWIGFSATVILYVLVGPASGALIAYRWRPHLWY